MMIKNLEEFIGKLSAVQTQNGKHKLVFIIMKEIEIPEDTINIHQLLALRGKRIGILNIDSIHKIRKITD